MQKFSTLANQIEEHSKKKKIAYYDQVDFIPDMQGRFNIHKLINIIHLKSKLKDTHTDTHMIISLDTESIFEKNPTPLHNKSSEKTRAKRHIS